jgi:alpha-tubulin suppressor-like RCC1 family protein
VDVVQCTGLNDRGQLGGKIQDPQNPTVAVLPGASKLAVGGDHACAFAPGNSKFGDSVLALYCWGANESGQVGIGNFEDLTTPYRVFW